ncbi:glycoside hydrolase/deacetylase [Guyanagaster necrorhizus]|uniref:chitin deacetylase n=1 Tax=Guyanagaster necrorhizus TaxID=856835 RepID=A0A9P7VGX6_9AGAR|nr:glycoside hydrolase/deacetylase [Guyanagaster necrorhizus MCA 3950]KAG7439769.1 glycoside hydrolase/deacetylase [Guyanagaster necrorhizus MCA 3950]
MKLHALVALLAALSTTAHAHSQPELKRHANLKRQTTSSSSASSSAVSSASSAASATVTTSVTGSSSSTGTAVVSSVSTAASAANSGVAATILIESATISGVPALTAITSGMSSGSTFAATTTWATTASPPVSGAPSLPTPFVYSEGVWPTQDKTPPTDTDEVQSWLAELDGWDIPDLEPTTDGTCASDPTFSADAASRGWWTCGAHTRDTDIINCPDKLTWGVSFDDGPGPYTQKLLNYLESVDISATFFVVGSRVIERPAVLVEEYMSGHEISVHTWAHPHLTTLTNEQIVAELGWTRKAIKEVIGVTPTTMRPPYGDIDDRVRAISLAMGLIPIIWTTAGTLGSFDTFDWEVAAGTKTGPECVQEFDNILGNASDIDTGIIVLEHDLYEVTVDLAIGYNLETAQNYNPAFTLKPIGECYGIPTTDLYRESNTNTSFPYTNTTTDVNGDGTADNTTTTTSSGTSTRSSSGVLTINVASIYTTFSLVGLMAFASTLL